MIHDIIDNRHVYVMPQVIQQNTRRNIVPLLRYFKRIRHNNARVDPIILSRGSPGDSQEETSANRRFALEKKRRRAHDAEKQRRSASGEARASTAEFRNNAGAYRVALRAVRT